MSLAKRIPYPWEPNGVSWPLPADYDSLDSQGQRLARVNAVRQWMRPVTDCPPHLTLREFLGFLRWGALDFFDRYYLWPDPSADFDPRFYDDTPVESPPFHPHICTMFAASRASISVCPRGSAKTGLNRKDMAMVLISRPSSSFYSVTSTHSNTRVTAQAVKDTCFFNQRIQDDFAPLPEFEGRIKPPKGEKLQGFDLFYLNNNSWLFSTSCESRNRGGRPRRIRLDDPEYDSTSALSQVTLVQNFHQMLFRVLMPMVLRSNTGIDWLATFVSKQHLAWAAMQVDQTPEGPRARDPNFNYWDRLQVNVIEYDADNKPHSAWPGMWPLTFDPKNPNAVTLQDMPKILGQAVFDAEMMGRPGDSTSTFFPALSEDLHGYSFSDIDLHFDTNPRASQTKIHFTTKGPSGSEPTKHVVPLCDFLEQCTLFITQDYAGTHNALSDYKVNCLQAFHPVHNLIFVLDLWSGQKPRSAQIDNAFSMCDRWRCPLLYPEVVRDSITLYNEELDLCRTRAMDSMGYTFIPSVRPIRPGVEPKSQKISSMLFRFEHGLIKLPLWRRNDLPWSRLFFQISGFNPAAGDTGGLEKDDELDTVSMHKFVLKGRHAAPGGPHQRPTDPLEILRSNDPDYANLNIGMGINWNYVTPAEVEERLSSQLPPPPSLKDSKL